MKVVSLIGARPQFIKEAVLNKQFKKDGLDEIIVNSGQHYDYNMADVFFETLGIKNPDYNLEVGSGLHGEMTAKIMIGFEKLVLKLNPDYILVYGDTNTTLAGAIVATKLKIPVAHVEAGVRMEPKDMPEEINRTLTDRISNLLFCAGKLQIKNLKKEGITRGVHFTGDVMYDLFLQMKEKFDDSVYKKLELEEENFYVVTLHRDYNVDDKEVFGKILDSLNVIAKDKRVIYPMHPRAKKMAEEFGFENKLEKFDVMDPIDYLQLMGLVSHSFAVITDSGGLQREAYYAKKRAFVVAPDPAWHEVVTLGMNILCNSSDLEEKIVNQKEYRYVPGVYGDGDAGKKIVNILKKIKSA
jgi:UDP-N-acetylglucosamine 2-epimerase (non-hydrolysing)